MYACFRLMKNRIRLFRSQTIVGIFCIWQCLFAKFLFVIYHYKASRDAFYFDYKLIKHWPCMFSFYYYLFVNDSWALFITVVYTRHFRILFLKSNRTCYKTSTKENETKIDFFDKCRTTQFRHRKLMCFSKS